MSKFTMEAEVEVKFVPVSLVETEVEYPTLKITFDYRRGSPAVMYQRNGDPGWPSEPAEVEFISAKLIDGKGLLPTPDQIDDWAREYLDSDDGFCAACLFADQESEADRADYEYDRKRDEAMERS